MGTVHVQRSLMAHVLAWRERVNWRLEKWGTTVILLSFYLICQSLHRLHGLILRKGETTISKYSMLRNVLRSTSPS